MPSPFRNRSLLYGTGVPYPGFSVDKIRAAGDKLRLNSVGTTTHIGEYSGGTRKSEVECPAIVLQGDPQALDTVREFLSHIPLTQIVHARLNDNIVETVQVVNDERLFHVGPTSPDGMMMVEVNPRECFRILRETDCNREAYGLPGEPLSDEGVTQTAYRIAAMEALDRVRGSTGIHMTVQLEPASFHTDKGYYPAVKSTILYPDKETRMVVADLLVKNTHTLNHDAPEEQKMRRGLPAHRYIKYERPDEQSELPERGVVLFYDPQKLYQHKPTAEIYARKMLAQYREDLGLALHDHPANAATAVTSGARRG